MTKEETLKILDENILKTQLRILAEAIVETQTVDDSEEGQYCPFCYEDHSYNNDKYPHEKDCPVLLAQEVLKEEQ